MDGKISNHSFGNKLLLTKLPDKDSVLVGRYLSGNGKHPPPCKLGVPLLFHRFGGVPGVTVIIVKDEMLGKAPREIPTMLDYRTHVEKGSMFNTPPVVPIYTLMENLRWLKANGGVEAADKRAHERAEVLYAEIDRQMVIFPTGDAR